MCYQQWNKLKYLCNVPAQKLEIITYTYELTV